MRTLVLILATLLLAGCPLEQVVRSDARPPKIATVTVTEHEKTPSWATDDLLIPHRTDDSVGAHLRNEDAQDAVLELAQCHRRLLRRMDAGEKVNPKECKK